VARYHIEPLQQEAPDFNWNLMLPVRPVSMQLAFHKRAACAR
jgi:hypothetical protein